MNSALLMFVFTKLLIISILSLYLCLFILLKSYLV